MTCKYFDERCSKTCKQDWCKCDICKEYIEPYNEDLDKTNGYTLQTAFIDCESSTTEDFVMNICPDCFKQIKSEMK